jgi:hypothetical protein
LYIPYAAVINLFRQRSPAVSYDGACDRLEQNTIFVGYLFRVPHENTARSVNDMRFDARGNQTDNLILKQLPVAGAIFVPDHQIHR